MKFYRYLIAWILHIKMLKYLLSVVAMLIMTENSFGQKILFGRVNDGSTKKPLPYVNVFVNNTTVGTVTGEDGKYTLSALAGENEVVFSFVGYQSKVVRTPSHGSDTVKIDMDLFPSIQELEAVTVHGSPDKEWAKLLKQFQKAFLGETRDAAYCAIRNAWCIDLKKEKISGKDVLVAHASQPLEIESLALGYKIFYDLQTFSSSKQTDKFSGNVYFVPLEPKDSIQAKAWEHSQRNAYQGSSRHLFKSMLNKKVKEEGFTLYAYETSKKGSQSLKEYPPIKIQFDSLKKIYRISIAQKIQIQYKDSATSGMPMLSEMYFANGYVEVDSEGILSDPFSVITRGYLIKSRVANLLPNDYQPRLRGNEVRDPILNREKTLKSADINNLTILDSLTLKAEHYSENHPTEKVYLHFDKPFYASGEDSWYKAYVVNGSDLNPINISSVLYVDWIDPSGKVINHKQLKIENGGAVGDFAIDTTLRAGTYTVRAYTNWMRNDDPELFYSKKIQVFDPRAAQGTLSTNASRPSPVDLQFFPEGGTLVAGVKTQIAFKAIQANGKGIDVHGKIVDEQNKLVTTFRSSHSGMGSFPFIGDTHKSFRAVLESGEVYPLPVPSESGLTLAASNMNSSKILMQIQSTNNDSMVYLIGQSQGHICYAESIKMNGTLKDISILKDDLPEGILQLTLFNSKGIPQCERMLFIKKDNRIVVSINSDKKQYAPRDSIILSFKIDDLLGDSLDVIPFSMTVTDADYISDDKNSENIYTRLLLQSDLKGNVANPGWYFETQTLEKTYALDLVMLTHGWSRYNWENILNPSPDSILFEPETGITLEGQILASNKPVPNAPFVVTIPHSENDFVNVYESDSLAKFKITGLDFYDSTLISWRVMNRKKGAIQNAKILLNASQSIPTVSQFDGQYPTTFESKNDPNEKILAKYRKTGIWNFDNSRMLDEFVVEAKRIEIVTTGYNQVALKPGPADLKVTTSQFVNRYASGLPFVSLQPMPDGTDKWLSARVKTIIISINGNAEVAEGFNGNPYLTLNSIPIDQIEYVTVASHPPPPATWEYFITVKTKTSNSQEGLGTIKQLTRGYDLAREFYHPKYEASEISSIAYDNRTTLYWNPNLQIDKDGIATVKFYNSDSTQKFLIRAEGIANGTPVSTIEIIGKAD